MGDDEAWVLVQTIGLEAKILTRTEWRYQGSRGE